VVWMERAPNAFSGARLIARRKWTIRPCVQREARSIESEKANQNSAQGRQASWRARFRMVCVPSLNNNFIRGKKHNF
jgi:hypothetical protein